MPATRSPLAMLSLLAHSSALSIDALYSLADTHASSPDHDHDLHFYGPYTHSHTHSLTQSLIHSLIHSLTHSHTHTHSLTHTHTLTHSHTHTLTD